MARTKVYPNSYGGRSFMLRVLEEHSDALDRIDGDTAAYQVAVNTIYARTTGSDTTGKGTLTEPYATMQRAVQDVPLTVPSGQRYVVDITGITEVLPANYRFPCWKGALAADQDLGSLYFLFAGAVAIQATPQLVASIPVADCTVATADIASSAQASISQMILVTLNVARASWAANAMKGKLVVGAVGGQENTVVIASTDTTLLLATTVQPTAPFVLMEPSASLRGTVTAGSLNTQISGQGAVRAFNCDSVVFNGLDIASDTASTPGAVMSGTGSGTMQMCKLLSPTVDLYNRSSGRILRCWVTGAPIMGGMFSAQHSFFDACTAMQFYMPGMIHLRRNGFVGCAPIESVANLSGVGVVLSPTDLFGIANCIVSGTPGATGDGVRFYGGHGRFQRLDVYGCGRDGIRCETGKGWLDLLTCGTTGADNTGYGILVNDGHSVRVDSGTSGAGANALAGTLGDMKVGALAARTWSDFVSATPALRPQHNEYNLADATTPVTGTGDTVTAPLTTVSGTGDTIDAATPQAGTARLTDAAGLFTAAMIGRAITIAGGDPGNNGTFLITGFLSATEILIANALAVTETVALTWTLTVPTSGVATGLAKLTDSAGTFTAAMVGRQLVITGGNAANNGTWLITGYLSATEILFANALAVTETVGLTWSTTVLAAGASSGTGSRLYQ